MRRPRPSSCGRTPWTANRRANRDLPRRLRIQRADRPIDRGQPRAGQIRPCVLGGDVRCVQRRCLRSGDGVGDVSLAGSGGGIENQIGDDDLWRPRLACVFDGDFSCRDAAGGTSDAMLLSAAFDAVQQGRRHLGKDTASPKTRNFSLQSQCQCRRYDSVTPPSPRGYRIESTRARIHDARGRRGKWQIRFGETLVA